MAPTCPPATGSTKRVVLFTKAPPACIPASSVWEATFKTSLGDIVVKMPAAASFAAVNNFVFLADYQYYNGTFFHRVVPGFAVQGGDPTGLGTGGAVVGGKSGEAKYGFPGYEFTGNTPPASCATKPSQAACYQPYDLVMANTGHATSDGSQFFFVLPGGQTQLSPLYTIFGKVTSGTSVVDRIGALGVQLQPAPRRSRSTFSASPSNRSPAEPGRQPDERNGGPHAEPVPPSRWLCAEDPALRRAATDVHRPFQALHRRDGHVQGHDGVRPRRGERSENGEQLRVPGALPLLRGDRVPPDHPGFCAAGRRSGGDRCRRARLPIRGRAAQTRTL